MAVVLYIARQALPDIAFVVSMLERSVEFYQ